MSISLTVVATRVATGITAVIAAEQAASKTVTDGISLAAKLMEGVDNAYSASNAAGSTKLAAVLAGVEAGLALVPADFEVIKGDVTAFVSAAKSVYNVLTQAEPVAVAPAVVAGDADATAV